VQSFTARMPFLLTASSAFGLGRRRWSSPQQCYLLQHSNSRFESIRYANRFESIRLVKNRPFDSLVVMQFFLVYLLYSLSQKK